MVYLTEELKKALYPTYTNLRNGEEVQDTTRLKHIKRTKINFLFAYHKMPLGETINFLEPFQNYGDVYNEFRGIFIKPFLCGILTAKHALQLAEASGILLINTLTRAGNIGESIVNIFVEAIYILGYALNTICTTAAVLPLFALRCLTTLISGAIELVTPSANYQSYYDEYNQSHPSTPSAPPLVHAEAIQTEDSAITRMLDSENDTPTSTCSNSV